MTKVPFEEERLAELCQVGISALRAAQWRDNRDDTFTAPLTSANQKFVDTFLLTQQRIRVLEGIPEHPVKKDGDKYSVTLTGVQLTDLKIDPYKQHQAQQMGVV